MQGWLTGVFPKQAGADDDGSADRAAGGGKDTSQTCPTCGKSSAFAGPPEHRFCMSCALRREMFG
jgi:hypothetical protein